MIPRYDIRIRARLQYKHVESAAETEMKVWNLLCNDYDKLTDSDANKVVRELSHNFHNRVFVIGRQHTIYDSNDQSQCIKQGLSQFIREALVSSLDDNEILLKLIEADNLNVSKRIDMLTELFPQVALLKNLEAADGEEKFVLLDEYLGKGLIDRHHMVLLIKICIKYPELLRHFIHHPECSTWQLVHIFKNSIKEAAINIAGNGEINEIIEISLLCLKQDKFVKSYEVYKEIARESFAKTICLPISANMILFYPFLASSSLEVFYKFIFSEYSELIDSQGLELISEIITKRYFDTSEACYVHNYKTSMVITEQEIVFNLNLYRYILGLVVSHPEYQFLVTANCSHDLKLFDWNSSVPRHYYYPFYFSAYYGFEDIFNRFYFHEDTSDKARKNAIDILKKNKRESILDSVAHNLFKNEYQVKFICFLMCVNNAELNYLPELKLIIFGFLTNSVHSDCITSLLATGQPPLSIEFGKSTSPCLFSSKEKSPSWLITRALVKIRDYENGKKSNDDKGGNRALCIRNALTNEKLSLNCKMFFLYALLTENTKCESTLQTSMISVLKPFFENNIKKTAQQYVKDRNQDLEAVKENLIAFIHKGYFQHDYFIDVNDEDLMNAITPEKSVKEIKVIKENNRETRSCVMM